MEARKSIYDQPPDLCLLEMLQYKGRWCIYMCSGAIDRGRIKTYGVLKDLYNRELIQPSSGKWRFWRVFFGRVGFELTPKGWKLAPTVR